MIPKRQVLLVPCSISCQRHQMGYQVQRYWRPEVGRQSHVWILIKTRMQLTIHRARHSATFSQLDGEDSPAFGSSQGNPQPQKHLVRERGQTLLQEAPMTTPLLAWNPPGDDSSPGHSSPVPACPSGHNKGRQ